MDSLFDIFRELPDQDIFRMVEDYSIFPSGNPNRRLGDYVNEQVPTKKIINLNNVDTPEREPYLRKIREKIIKNQTK